VAPDLSEQLVEADVANLGLGIVRAPPVRASHGNTSI
jgi:hypothetical protein